MAELVETETIDQKDRRGKLRADKLLSGRMKVFVRGKAEMTKGKTTAIKETIKQ